MTQRRVVLMKCPKCQTENPVVARFCLGCGQQLEPKLVCPRCHHTNSVTAKFCEECAHSLIEPAPEEPSPPPPSVPQPTSFVNGRYTVKKFLGEGGKKKVYLAYDTLLDRDVAFALIKSENVADASIRMSSRSRLQATM